MESYDIILIFIYVIVCINSSLLYIAEYFLYHYGYTKICLSIYLLVDIWFISFGYYN